MSDVPEKQDASTWDELNPEEYKREMAVLWRSKSKARAAAGTELP